MPSDSSDTLSPLPEILSRYLSGESVQVLAHESSVSRQTIYNWLLAGVGDRDYFDLITQGLVNRIADADEAIENSATMFDIARAREMARFSRMDFERRRPQLYGPKQTDSSTKILVIVNREHAVESQVKQLDTTTGSSLPSPSGSDTQNHDK